MYLKFLCLAYSKFRMSWLSNFHSSSVYNIKFLVSPNNFVLSYSLQKNGTKNRRNVVFKKQNYHNVYEYPKENAVLSPPATENKIWTSYLANSSPLSTSVSDSYLNNDSTDYYGKKHSIDFNALDGFTVSSSSRPFHLSQYSSDCHTWPTDSDFSWSQLQVRTAA